MKAKVPSEITEAAGDWFDVLSSGPANVSQREAFVDWMGQSPVHVAEFLRVSALHAELSDSLTLLPEWTEEILRKEGASSAPLFEVRGGDSEAMTASPRLNEKPPSRNKVLPAWLSAAAIMLLGIFTYEVRGLDDRPTTLLTALGEQRVVLLDDGSRLQLNTDSKVRILFDDEVREVALIRGELFVDVEKDHRRPFLVTTDTAIVQATGTQFNVYRDDSATEVVVVEGSVSVQRATSETKFARDASDRISSLQLNVGQKTIVAESQELQTSSFVDVSRAIAWTERRLIFDDELVATIANEFNRYNKTKFIVSDPYLANARISGVFDVNDPEAFTTLLDSLHALEIQTTDAGELRLSYKSNE